MVTQGAGEGEATDPHRLRADVHHALDAYADQMARLAHIRGHLDSIRINARSVDGHVTVTVDSAGVVTDIQLERAAMRNQPESLARKITEVAREAAMYAEKYTVESLAPIAEIVDAMPDLPDLIPGAPSLKDTGVPEL